MYSRRYAQLAFELLVITACKVLFMPLVRRNKAALAPRNFEKQAYLIVSNHRRGLDPFIIIAAMPYRTFFNLAPVNFMMHNAFYDSLLRPFAWLAGCYPARNPRGKHQIFGVEGSVVLLQHGFSIMMFPEGTRVHNQARGPARPGIIAIHQHRPSVPMLLAHIEYSGALWRATITYKLLPHPNFSDPEKLMDEVFMLH